MNPTFLNLDDILMIHSNQVELFGGDPSIRDLDLLKSAIAQPSAGFGEEYFHKDIYEMAAAYLFHICKNHPFVDGNKRTAGASATTFLKVNQIEFIVDEDTFAQFVIDVACSRLEKPEIAEFFRNHSNQPE